MFISWLTRCPLNMIVKKNMVTIYIYLYIMLPIYRLTCWPLNRMAQWKKRRKVKSLQPPSKECGRKPSKLSKVAQILNWWVHYCDVCIVWCLVAKNPNLCYLYLYCLVVICFTFTPFIKSKSMNGIACFTCAIAQCNLRNFYFVF